ncbi:CoA transferase [Stappia taiwanensis]|uniref:CoA transferase n=1 Tax=Stappia taiwanensis TaxID=992267 RepID=A0A838XMS5_9HYPH|nr:CaiB/BaiF CoA-transferase family protein [Stappia taiwanensis]MBA4612579.1 CoA transferase [Stappia taiwanensis]GGE89360.1 CoA transferase [Stappia taiwanensis]
MCAERSSGPLDGLLVLDLSRILAGPTATQLLGDLGARVIKIERPGRGDDTRGWGPPFLRDADGRETAESAYYLSANRNKQSLAIDLASTGGQEIIRQLAARADVLVENFKVGDLARRGLGYDDLKAANPGLIYCSISGFGQTGPYAHRPGYDFLIQGMGGIMSLTGRPDEEGGEPTKAGVGIADVMCGMYASNAILAALHHRTLTGEGQYIDIALFDTQVAWLINQGVGYLTDGQVPPRRGNAHPTIVPYNAYPASDGSFILAVGNDDQFARFCQVAGAAQLATDPRFARNADRVRRRSELEPLIRDLTRARPAAEWIAALEAAGVPCGPINDLAGVFADPQTQARGMRIALPHETARGGAVDLIGNPVKLSRTPVTYRHAPPRRGADGVEVLRGVLGLNDKEIAALIEGGVLDPGDDV